MTFNLSVYVLCKPNSTHQSPWKPSLYKYCSCM